MNAQDPHELLTEQQRQLYELMSEISEDCYCAGWMMGNEYTLWSAIQTGEMRYGMGDIDRELLAKVAALSVQTGTWIVWRDDTTGLPKDDSTSWGPYAIPLVEWGAIYESKNDMAKERSLSSVGAVGVDSRDAAQSQASNFPNMTMVTLRLSQIISKQPKTLPYEWFAADAMYYMTGDESWADAADRIAAMSSPSNCPDNEGGGQ